MEAGQEYSNGWHQCVSCGVTWPERHLTQRHRKDEVLGIDEMVYVCQDTEECARWKFERQEHLDREKEKKTPAMINRRLAAEDRERAANPRPTTPARRRR